MKPNRAAVSVINQAEISAENCGLPIIRVLIIDDQNLFRQGLVHLLSTQEDLEIVGSSDNIRDAIESLQRLNPDVALVGWPAGSVNSQKIFNAIQEAKLATRVIMLVSDDIKEDFVEAVKQGCCGVVPKQTSTELLIKSIRKVHAGEFWLDRMTTAEVI